MGTENYQIDELGRRLREERLRLGLTQEDCGALAGVTRRTQSEYEAGRVSPDAAYLAAIGAAGADVVYILTGSTAHRAAREPGAEYRSVSPRQAAILDMISEMGEDGLREVLEAAAKEKRLEELERLAAARRA